MVAQIFLFHLEGPAPEAVPPVLLLDGSNIERNFRFLGSIPSNIERNYHHMNAGLVVNALKSQSSHGMRNEV